MTGACVPVQSHFIVAMPYCHVIFVQHGCQLNLTEMLRTADCFGGRKLAWHVPSSS